MALLNQVSLWFFTKQLKLMTNELEEWDMIILWWSTVNWPFQVLVLEIVEFVYSVISIFLSSLHRKSLQSLSCWYSNCLRLYVHQHSSGTHNIILGGVLIVPPRNVKRKDVSTFGWFYFSILYAPFLLPFKFEPSKQQNKM